MALIFSPYGCVWLTRSNSLILNFAIKKTGMARSTFKVLSYVNGSKEKNGIVPIMGRVTINMTVAQFSYKQRRMCHIIIWPYQTKFSSMAVSTICIASCNKRLLSFRKVKLCWSILDIVTCSDVGNIGIITSSISDGFQC